MRNDLGIAVCNESMSASPQFIPALDVIKQLAVENNSDVAIFVKDRLLAIGQTDNAQPARSRTEPWPNKKAFLVRASVEQRAGHSLHAPFGNGTLSHQIDHARDAAHKIVPLIRNSPQIRFSLFHISQRLLNWLRKNRAPNNRAVVPSQYYFKNEYSVAPLLTREADSAAT